MKKAIPFFISQAIPPFRFADSGIRDCLVHYLGDFIWLLGGDVLNMLVRPAVLHVLCGRCLG